MSNETPANKMHEVEVNKLVINIGTADDDQRQVSARRLLELITKRKPADGISKKRLPEFKIVKGKKIGAFVTMRGDESTATIGRLFEAVDKKVKEESISENTVNFGIREYIDINGVKYDPKVGMMGMNVNISFKRKGGRVATRKIKRGKIPERHKMVTREEIKEFLGRAFGVSTTTET
ncbi:MAG: 50S ribosomal protein L5 [Candidatus Marsarchaeota archaeon]|nr:50S ribosomal protein L5 [Candidatus Marsarchaeota archaeon]